MSSTKQDVESARVCGEMIKLGVKISDPTARRIMIENGFNPAAARGESTWKEFLKRHKETPWACDFFTKNVMTAGGIVPYHVLFFIHVHIRRMRVAGAEWRSDGLTSPRSDHVLRRPR